MEEATVTKIDKNKIATEVCEAEFARFVEAMDLDVDPAGMDDEDKSSFRAAYRALIGAMEVGRLIVNENGEMVYTPQLGSDKPITFHEPTGASMMAMDKKKEGHNITKTYATMADMTQLDIKHFSNMSMRDLKICQYILILFLA